MKNSNEKPPFPDCSSDIDQTIPLIEDLGSILVNNPSDGGQSEKVYRYRVTLPDLAPFQFEGRLEDFPPSLELWLLSVQKQFPEYFQGEDVSEYRRSHGKFHEELRKRNGEIHQLENSGLQ